MLLISCNLHASSITSHTIPTQHLQYKIISFFVELFSNNNAIQDVQNNNGKSSNDIVSTSKLNTTKSVTAFFRLLVILDQKLLDLLYGLMLLHGRFGMDLAWD